MIPRKIFFTKGVGVHKHYLQSFELALRNAGIERANIVTVSSIFPPNAEVISKEQGLKYIKSGAITFVVMARNATNEPNRLIAASIGAAIPSDKSTYGYLSEHHPNGETEGKAGDYAEDLAATMLATTLGLEFDPDKAWDERKQEFMMSGKIVKTRNITQSAQGNKYGLWTSVVACAVLITDQMIDEYNCRVDSQRKPLQNSKEESSLKKSIKRPFALARSVFARKKEDTPETAQSKQHPPGLKSESKPTAEALVEETNVQETPGIKQEKKEQKEENSPKA